MVSCTPGILMGGWNVVVVKNDNKCRHQRFAWHVRPTDRVTRSNGLLDVGYD